MESLFPPDNGKSYGFFGYQGWCCDGAIRSDDVAKLQETIGRGWMVPSTRTLFNDSMVAYARRCNAPRCAEYLLSLGWE